MNNNSRALEEARLSLEFADYTLMEARVSLQKAKEELELAECYVKASFVISLISLALAIWSIFFLL